MHLCIWQLPYATHLNLLHRNYWIKELYLLSVSLLFFFVSLLAHFYMGSLFLMSCRQSFLLCTIPTSSCFSRTSAAMQSFHLVFGLPLPLCTCTSMSIILLSTTSSSLLSMWPYHFNLACCIFFDSSATFTVPLIRVLGILSLLVTPDIHLNIFTSATFILFSFTFLIGVDFLDWLSASIEAELLWIAEYLNCFEIFQYWFFN